MVNLLTLGCVVSALISGANYFMFPAILETAIKGILNLDEKGPVYPQYMNPPIKSKSKFYVYEVKNPK